MSLKITRREFLKKSLAVSVSAALPVMAFASTKKEGDVLTIEMVREIAKLMNSSKVPSTLAHSESIYLLTESQSREMGFVPLEKYAGKGYEFDGSVDLGFRVYESSPVS